MSHNRHVNAASKRGFVVEANPQRKNRRLGWPCYILLFLTYNLKLICK